MDEQLVEIRKSLIEIGALENTLVMFISDNGLQWGQHGIGGKMVPYVESIRVPFFAMWPRHFEQGVSDRLVANIDIAPTILDAAEGAISGDQGWSVTPR